MPAADTGSLEGVGGPQGDPPTLRFHSGSTNQSSSPTAVSEPLPAPAVRLALADRLFLSPSRGNPALAVPQAAPQLVIPVSDFDLKFRLLTQQLYKEPLPRSPAAVQPPG